MARYQIETKQYSGQWLFSGAKADTATSRDQGMVRARTQEAVCHCPKRLVDTKTGAVLLTVGETDEREVRAARLRSIESRAAERCERVEPSYYGQELRDIGPGEEFIGPPTALDHYLENLEIPF